MTGLGNVQQPLNHQRLCRVHHKHKSIYQSVPKLGQLPHGLNATPPRKLSKFSGRPERKQDQSGRNSQITSCYKSTTTTSRPNGLSLCPPPNIQILKDEGTAASKHDPEGEHQNPTHVSEGHEEEGKEMRDAAKLMAEATRQMAEAGEQFSETARRWANIEKEIQRDEQGEAGPGEGVQPTSNSMCDGISTSRYYIRGRPS